MAYELIVHAPDGDIIIGSYPTQAAAEKLAAITIPHGEKWSVVEIDGEAREAGVSLFEGMEIPRSHYSWSFAQATEPQIQRVVSEGWAALKAKGYANYGETRRFLEQCARVGEKSS